MLKPEGASAVSGQTLEGRYDVVFENMDNGQEIGVALRQGDVFDYIQRAYYLITQRDWRIYDGNCTIVSVDAIARRIIVRLADGILSDLTCISRTAALRAAAHD